MEKSKMEKCIDCGKLFNPYKVEDECAKCGGTGYALEWNDEGYYEDVECSACGGSGDNEFTERKRCKDCFDIYWEMYDDDY